MDHFNKSLTALTSLDHQCFWEKNMVDMVMKKFNNKIRVWLLHIHIMNEVAQFWVFAGEPLIVSIQHCQLRDGRQNKINFQILLFFL